MVGILTKSSEILVSSIKIKNGQLYLGIDILILNTCFGYYNKLPIFKPKYIVLGNDGPYK